MLKRRFVSGRAYPGKPILIGENSRIQSAQSANSVFVMFENEKCFWTFVSRFVNVSDDSRISGALNEICGMETFCNVYLLLHDFAANITYVVKREILFFICLNATTKAASFSISVPSTAAGSAIPQCAVMG